MPPNFSDFGIVITDQGGCPIESNLIKRIKRPRRSLSKIQI